MGRSRGGEKKGEEEGRNEGGEESIRDYGRREEVEDECIYYSKNIFVNFTASLGRRDELSNTA